MGSNNGGLGGIVGVGVIAILLIICGAILPLSADWKWALVLAGIGILLALVGGALFKSSLLAAVIVWGLAVIAFSFALKHVSNAITPKSLTATPQLTIPLLLSRIRFHR
jgi:hypothetical protein